MKMIKKVILRSILIYKQFISPHLGYHCKFYPTCSEYFFQATRKYGVWLGAWKGIKRILRCNPFSGGGVDEP